MKNTIAECPVSTGNGTGLGKLKVERRAEGEIDVTVRVATEYITFAVTSDDFIKLSVLESSSQFSDVHMRF